MSEVLSELTSGTFWAAFLVVVLAITLFVVLGTMAHKSARTALCKGGWNIGPLAIFLGLLVFLSAFSFAAGWGSERMGRLLRNSYEGGSQRTD
jgi:hypothetical protein